MKDRTIKTPGLSREDRLRIVREALCDERSVGAAYSGHPMRPLTRERIVRAARELKLPEPSSPSPLEVSGRLFNGRSRRC